ncbi:MAG: hypothetical protein HON51_03580 [Gammaproteobacteria bacterium]|jgi:uncharacterized low-complexity protein|nr:hypothetical protein [Gammaproteobacteria bacterium]MBT5826452.1 hypothetical protein [Gammaproteobacteria bacterium]MBT6420240.1 hypothetical protein [Gammaproteobacteria bacterium]MBT6575312.1 hypothetical protein [Gammaproteobacteria bacterium]MBT7435607.1 hypothetical protein [Gammaproteobacteria bacterium]
MNKINKTKFIIGTSIIAGFTSGCASGDKPFAQKDLSSGYMNESETAKLHGTEKAKDGSCGEGKCGGKMAAPAVDVDEESKMPEGKCGEGKCGGEK